MARGGGGASLRPSHTSSCHGTALGRHKGSGIMECLLLCYVRGEQTEQNGQKSGREEAKDKERVKAKKKNGWIDVAMDGISWGQKVRVNVVGEEKWKKLKFGVPVNGGGQNFNKLVILSGALI